MQQSLANGKNTELNEIDPFVDGAAVEKLAMMRLHCAQLLDKLVLVSEGKICQSILKLYNKEAIVVEPAGAMSTASLKMITKRSKEKMWFV